MILYDQPIEVTEKQYRPIIREFSGLIAHRTENGKFWIKLWIMRYREQLEKRLKELAN